MAESNIECKLALDTGDARGPLVKRLNQNDLAGIKSFAKSQADRKGVTSELKMTYFDGAADVLVEDEADLQAAFGVARRDLDCKLTFTVKPVDGGNFTPIGAEESKDQPQGRRPKRERGPASDKPAKAKGLKKREIKSLINAELEKQAHELLHAQQTLPNVEISEMPDDATPIIEGAAAQDSAKFVKEIMHAFRGRLGNGRGARGQGNGQRGGFVEQGRGPLFTAMMENFSEKMNAFSRNMSPEEWQSKMQAEFATEDFQQKMTDAFYENQWRHVGGSKWKEARAVCKAKPEAPVELAAGASQSINITVLNDTHAPWKQGSSITLANKQTEADLPIEIFSVPVVVNVIGKQETTVSVPLTRLQSAASNPDKVYELALSFRCPRGNQFGQIIPIQVKCI